MRHNPGWYVPGLATAGSFEAIAAGLAGKRALVLAATHDAHFPTDGTLAVVDAFPPGVADVSWREGPHELTAQARDQLVEWLAGTTAELTQVEEVPSGAGAVPARS